MEFREGRPKPYKARVRWTDPSTGEQRSKSKSTVTPEEAQGWIDDMVRAASGGINPAAATQPLVDYGTEVMPLAIRGLERKTLDPYLAGWRLRIVPSLGHIPVRMITNGVVDRAVYSWIEDECSRSTIKNTLAMLVRVLEQAVRDGLVDRNVGQVKGWQRQYQQAEDELDDPRSLALPDWETLVTLADALVARSHGHFTGWGHVVTFAGCTAARIGEVSGIRAGDIDGSTWTWTVRRQTTPGPGGLIDKGTKGKRARKVPIIEEVRPMVVERLNSAAGPDTRLFTGPRGGRISTAVLRDATHWDEVVTAMGYEHLRRHDLRHTGLTWMADAGVKVHVLRKIAGHGSLSTTQRYLHPDQRSIDEAGDALSAHLKAPRSPDGPQLRVA
ncbi:site-specific integrase [Actinoplanes sp. HUAS TT8]|uniref:site-specific integrase n=1 Tax=Actinoplanes sp. HUAS TT8 TaxID=3447453 RepID=UPI003F51F9AA